MDATKYRPVEETYPFFDVTLSSNGEVAGISAFDVSAYAHNGAGTRIALRGTNGWLSLEDLFADFEKRLFDCLAVNILGDVEETAEVKVDDPDHILPAKTDQEPKSAEAPRPTNQPTKKK